MRPDAPLARPRRARRGHQHTPGLDLGPASGREGGRAQPFHPYWQLPSLNLLRKFFNKYEEKKEKKWETGRGLAAPRPPAPPLTDFGLSSNRHKDQAPAAAAGVTYGFPQACPPRARPPAARRRRRSRLVVYIDVGSRGF